jgi:hypothetical protein
MTDAELMAATLEPRVDCERDAETGLVVLLKPRFRSRWLRRLLAPAPDRQYVKIHLDEIGSWVWDHLGEAETVGDLAEALAAAFPAEKAAAQRVTLFARQLAGSGLIRICRREA